MSKLICSSAIDGAVQWVAQAEARLAHAIQLRGEACAVAFPNTAYYLPVIYSFTGESVTTLGEMRAILQHAKRLLPARPAENVWLPYLGNTLDAGAAALFACEIIEACKYVVGPPPVDGIWLGAANDVIMRERGIEFVDGTAPGFAAVVGAAPTQELAVRIARELQEKNLYVFMAGSTNGVRFAEQLEAAGVQLGWETRLVPFGREVSAAIYALGFANRAALSFGGVRPGDFAANLRYNKDRVFAFVLALGEVTPDKYAVAAGAINYGFPVIADTDIPQILPTGVCTYEHVVSNVAPEAMVERALEVRGCKIKITQVPIPVPYGPAFEGERIRKADAHAEFGGNRTTAFEFVTSAGLDEIADGDVQVVGPDIDQVPAGSALPLGIWVEVAGRKMQPDFEPILERQIHHLVNGAEGIWHMGQRDIVWTRVSKAGFARGLRLRHYGDILHAKLRSDYPAIVDKVKVTLITDAEEVARRVAVARKVYDERNRRLESMTDESVETFYSCLLCQSFAPDHVCIITPERLGLCGAYNWLDGKAAFEIDDTGPNQPVQKGECLDPVRGVWRGVDEFVYANSHKAVRSFCAYSIMDRPMTSCGCFEVIVAYVPECNGVMAVNREYQGETPAGMTFSTLAGSVGGGQQTPGFMGCGKVFLTSRKFLFADGGHKRLVWMPKELKNLLADDLDKRFADQGVPGLLEKIADETVGHEAAAVRAFMEKVGHPALQMDDMTIHAEAAPKAPSVPAPAGTSSAVAQPASAAETTESAPAVSAPAPPKPAAPAPVAATAQAPAPAPAAAAAPVPLAAATPELPPAAPVPPAAPAAPSSPPPGAPIVLTAELLAELKAQIAREVRAELTQLVVREIIGTLSQKFLGGNLPAAAPVAAAPSGAAPSEVAPTVPVPVPVVAAAPPAPSAPAIPPPPPAVAAAPLAAPPEAPQPPPSVARPRGPRAAERLAAIKAFPLPQEKSENAVWTVKLGATKAEGGTRGRTYTIGGARAMPFHHWEGAMPHRPRVAMEVFDVVSEKLPPVLAELYGPALRDPAALAVRCVEEWGAELISVRLDGTHPERGNRRAEEAVATVQSVLRAVDVPLIVTGHNHFERNNEVLKAVAQACAGENLLLNWVEQNNYRTIAGAALGYGHALVAQSPIDVNIGKQLNILLTNMDVKQSQIVMDPMTGALGYGLEYTYSVMERMRLTGLGGDKMLAGPMIVSPGQECAKVKELKASEKEFPAWGPLAERAALWELGTALGLLYAGADLLIMYHPVAVAGVKRAITELMDDD